ncbi:MAG: hypothetical protein ACPHL6_11995 [Rubripirellula sp.]
MLASSVSAHPGHGESSSTHYFTEPAHAIPLLILGLVMAFLVSGWQKTRTTNARVKI